MHKVSPWLFILIAIMWLLPLVGMTYSAWMGWIALLAMALIGVLELISSK